ncbi:MAG TPA: SprT-like domain-containing protein [Longimicrobium sp.]|nr:SprT-like domain-containing protein [Longimicrobium sp.]
MKKLAEVLDLFGWGAPAPRPEPPPSPRPAPSPEPRRAPAPAPGARTEAQALAVVARVAPHFRRVVFTRNRRIMASLARQGTELRLNVAFASADEAVLVATAKMFSARDRRTRLRHRAVVREFIARIDHTPAPVRPRQREVHDADRFHLQRLQGEFDRTNAAHFGGELPRVPLYLSGRMKRRNGHFSSHPLEIVISRKLCTRAAPEESEETLRHEMIHLWQHHAGRRPDHGAEFRALARRLDVHPRATRPVRWKR